jgi:asparagine synthase (glutamine-hydrolysing)
VSGLCAVVSRTAAPPDVYLLQAMEAAAPHRAGGWTGRCLTSRAAIAQLNRSDHPPALVRHPQTGVTVAADARIDNRDELRSVLGADPGSLRLHQPGGAAHGPRGEEGTAAGDAGLVAAAYLRWGSPCLERLVGDFALIVWDPRRMRLLLARDPMGMRALYYRAEPGRILAATEAKQLRAAPGVPDEPDERMAACYLAGAFGAPEWSYQRGIRQVPPGHAVLVGERSVRTLRFWDVDPGLRVSHPTPAGYAAHLRELFVEAVRTRIRGDRPAGSLLSGGLDSGAAAAAAGLLVEQEALAPGLYSYSWDFGSLVECDERHISRHIVSRYGLASRDVPVADAGPLAGYPAHAPDPDDPFHGHFQVVLDRAFARARDDGVGPLLTGMRGDLAAGPIDLGYRRLFLEGRWADLRAELVRHEEVTGEGLLALARRRLLPGMAKRMAPRALARALRRRGEPPRERHGAPTIPPWIHPELVERVDLPELLSAYGDVPAPELDGPFRRRRYQWLFAPMHLRWAVSHERRVARFGATAVDPWSDRRVVEFCVAIPQQVLDTGAGPEKPLVRRAMRGVMPEPFRREARKTPPTRLYDETLRQASAATVRNLLSNSRSEARGWLVTDPLREAFERFVTNGGPPPAKLWWALSLEWWLREREREPPLRTGREGLPDSLPDLNIPHGDAVRPDHGRLPAP